LKEGTWWALQKVEGARSVELLRLEGCLDAPAVCFTNTHSCMEPQAPQVQH